MWQSQDANPGSLSPEPVNSPATAGEVLPVLSMLRATLSHPSDTKAVTVSHMMWQISSTENGDIPGAKYTYG